MSDPPEPNPGAQRASSPIPGSQKAIPKPPSSKKSRAARSPGPRALHVGWLVALVLTPAVLLGIWRLVQLIERLRGP